MTHTQIESIRSGSESFETMALRAVVYARVSTNDIKQEQSLENQRETYEEIIRAHKNWTFVRTYVDNAITGTKAALRPDFMRMIEDAKDGQFDIVLVKDVSRFARNIKELLIYTDQLKECGVMVFFYKEKIDTISPMSDMLLKFMAIGAEMEARNAQGRTRMVFEKGVQDHKVYGNSKILGYRKDHCSLVIDEEEAKIVQIIFDLYVNKGMGTRRIAKELASRNLTRASGTQISARTISTVLANPKYKGFYCGGKTVKIEQPDKYIRRMLPEDQWVMCRDEKIPVIVDESLWNEAERIRHMKTAKHSATVRHPINRGMYRYSSKIESDIVPGVNYTRAVYTYKGVSREYWHCRNYKDVTMPENVGPVLYTEDLDRIVKDLLNGFALNSDEVAAQLISMYKAAIKGIESEQLLKRLEKKIMEAKQMQERLLDTLLNGTIDEDRFAIKDRELSAEIKELTEKKVEIEKALQNTSKQIDLIRSSCNEIVKQVQEQQPSQSVIDSLIDKIHVCKDSTKESIHLEVVLKLDKSSRSYRIAKGKIDSCDSGNKNTSMPASNGWPS